MFRATDREVDGPKQRVLARDYPLHVVISDVFRNAPDGEKLDEASAVLHHSFVSSSFHGFLGVSLCTPHADSEQTDVCMYPSHYHAGDCSCFNGILYQISPQDDATNILSIEDI